MVEDADVSGPLTLPEGLSEGRGGATSTKKQEQKAPGSERPMGIVHETDQLVDRSCAK